MLPYANLAGWTNQTELTKGGIMFWSSMFAVIMVLGCATYVAYSFIKNRFKYLWPLKILRNIASIFVSVGFIPIATIFLQNIRCNLDLTATACFDELNIEWAVATMIIAVFFVIFVFVVQGSYYEDDPTKQTLDGRPHSRAELVHLIMRLCITVMWQMMRDKAYHVFIMSSMAVLTFAGAFVFTWYLPFYSLSVGLVRTILAWMQCWGAIAVTVAVIQDDINDPSPIIAFYIGTPVVAFAAYLLVLARRDWILHTPIKDFSSPFEVQLKVYLLSKQVPQLWISKADEEERNSASEGHFDDERERALQEFADVAAKHYSDGVKKFANSSLMYLMRGQFYLTVLKQAHLGTRSLTKASERNPHFDERFLIYKRRKKANEENSGGGGVDIITSIAYEQYMKDALKYDREASMAQFVFWNALLSTNTNIHSLHQHAFRVSKFMDLCETNYTKVIGMSQKTASALRVYAGFLRDLHNDQEKSQTIMNQADEMEERVRLNVAARKQNINGANDINDEGIDQSVGVVVISADDKLLGVITKVNNFLCMMMGYSQSELVGKNVEMVVPAPWSTFHQSLIHDFLDSGNSYLTKEQRPIFGRHSDGTIVRIKFMIKEVVDSEGNMSFLGMVQTGDKIPNIDINSLIVLRASSDDQSTMNFVLGCSRGCRMLFPYDASDSKTNISRLMPFYKEERNRAMKDEGVVRIAYAFDSNIEQEFSEFPVPVFDENKDLVHLAPHDKVQEIQDNTEEHFNSDRKYPFWLEIRFVEKNARDKQLDIVEIHTPMCLRFHSILVVLTRIIISARQEMNDVILHRLEVIRGELNSMDLDEQNNLFQYARDSFQSEHSHEIFLLLEFLIGLSMNTNNKQNDTHEEAQISLESSVDSILNTRSLDDTCDQESYDVSESFDKEQNIADQQARRERMNLSRRSSFIQSEHETEGDTKLNVLSSKLMRASLETGRAIGLSKSMKSLRTKLLLLCFIASISIIGSYIYLQLVFSDFTGSLGFIARAGARVYHLSSILYATQWLTLISRGFAPAQDTVLAHTILFDSSVKLKESTEELYDMREALSEEHRKLLEEASVNISVVINGEARSESVTLVEASARVASKASLMVQSDVSDINMDNDNVFFVMKNSQSDLLNKLNVSSHAFQEKMIKQVDNITMLAWIATVFTIGLISICTLVLVRPSVSKSLLSQIQTLQVFSELPESVAQMLRSRCSARIDLLREVQAEMFPDDDVRDEDHHRLMLSSTMNTIEKNDSDSENPTSENDLDEDIKENNSVEKSKERSSAAAENWQMSCKIFAFIITIILYYVLVFFTIGYESALDDMRFGAAKINWSQYRRMKMREALFMTRHFAAPANNTLFTLEVDDAFMNLDELHNVHQGLIFGNEQMLSPGLISISGHTESNSVTARLLRTTRMQIMFQNACVEGTSVEDIARCGEIQHRLLQNGLHVSIREFSRHCREQISIFERLPANENNTESDRFQSDILNSLREIESDYLQLILTHEIELQISELQMDIEAFHSAHLTVSIIFVLLLILLFFCVYDPLVRDLDKQNKNSKTMLLCIPDDELEKVESIATLMAGDA